MYYKITKDLRWVKRRDNTKIFVIAVKYKRLYVL